MAQLKTI